MIVKLKPRYVHKLELLSQIVAMNFWSIQSKNEKCSFGGRWVEVGKGLAWKNQVYVKKNVPSESDGQKNRLNKVTV